jgi:predicted DNA-binding transcriptional regulator AlpA
MADLVGIAEIALRAGVARDTIRKWRQRHPDFPQPLITLATGPVWDYAEIQAWIAKPRPPGRPRKETP